MNAKLRITHRKKSRGVALVESSVVMPALISVLGLMTYNFKSYEGRIKANLESRANVVDVASHNCESSTSSAASLLDMGIGVVNEATANAGAASGNGGATEVLGKLSKAASSVLKVDVLVKGWSRTVTGGAKMTCNEAPFDGNIGSWFSYAAKAFTGFGANKFP